MWRFGPALDAGFFIFWSLDGFRKAELEGEFAPGLRVCTYNPERIKAEQVSPARHVPVQPEHSDRLGTKGSLTTERLASPRR